MPLSTVFQSYHRDSSHYSHLSRVSPVLGSNPDSLDYKSNALPLSHAGPVVDPWTLLQHFGPVDTWTVNKTVYTHIK